MGFQNRQGSGPARDMLQNDTGKGGEGATLWVDAGRPLLLFAGFVFLALVVRLPAFAHSVIDQDESLYLILGNELLDGHLPGTRLFDYKPLFLFTLFASFQVLFADDILAIRVLGILCVAASAFLLSRLSRIVFPGEGAPAVAGLLYIVMTVTNGGLATNAEIVLHPFLLAGALLLLKTLAPGLTPFRVTGACLAAGLLLGLGYQVKPVIAFDIIGLFIFIFFLRLFRRGAAAAAWEIVLRRGLVSFAGFCVPLIATILIYAVSGALDIWRLMLTFSLSGAAQPFELWRAGHILTGLAPFAVLVPPVAFSAARTIANRGSAEYFAIGGLFAWTAVTIIGIVLAGYYLNHHFLLLAPMLCLIASHGFCQAWRQTGLSVGIVPASTQLAAATIAMALLVHPQAYIEAGTVVVKRHQTQNRDYGDLPRRLAAYLARESSPGEPVFVYGYQPILYYLAASPVPTRFPFADHLAYEYSANVLTELGFDLGAEIDATMSRHPRFVILESDRQYRQTAATERLMFYLERDYECLGIFVPDRELTSAYQGAPGSASVYKRKALPS